MAIFYPGPKGGGGGSQAQLIDNGDGTYTYNDGSGSSPNVIVIDTRASSNPYDNALVSPGLVSTNVQDAIDELLGLIEVSEGNAFEVINTGSGSVSATGSDEITFADGNAIEISVISGSPKTIQFSVDPTEINLEELGNVIAGSPLVGGYTLIYRDGSPPGWYAEPSSATDEFVKVSGGDTNTGHLDDKIEAVGPLTKTILYPGGDEVLSLELDLQSISIQDLGNVQGDGSPGDIPQFSVLASQTHDFLTPVTVDLSSPEESQLLYFDTVNGVIKWIPESEATNHEHPQYATDVYNAISDGGNTLTASGKNNTLTFEGEDGITVEVGQAGSPPVDTVTVSSELLSNLELAIIDGQPMLVFNDNTRLTGGSPPTIPKKLSVAEQSLTWGENRLGNNDWIEIGNAVDATSGYIMDFDGTVVFATAHCSDTGSRSKDIHLYLDGTDEGSVGTLSGGLNSTFINTTLDVDFVKGTRIRLRAVSNGANGAIQDTVIKLTVKWRK